MCEDEEEEYLHDIISLNYFPIKTESVVIDLSSDDEDDKSRVFAPLSSYGNRCFVLPITFFDISKNVEFLKKCRPLSVKVVDCNKHPLYYENILRRKKTPCGQTFSELTISKDLFGVDFKRNKGLVGLVISKKDSESKKDCNKIVPVDKRISKEKDSIKKSIKDIGKTSKKLEKVVIKLNKQVSESSGVLEKDSSTEGSIIAEEIPKNVVANEKKESEYSPTRCSIKITCPKVFEKAIKLKSGCNRNPSEAKTVMHLSTEKVITKDQVIPKLSLKRKKSDIKEFYIINQTKQKSHSDCENKKTKNSDESQKKVNETFHQTTKPESNVTCFITETMQSSLISKTSSCQGQYNCVKPVSKMNRNDINFKYATPGITYSKVSLECSRGLLNCQSESNCNVQKSDKVIKPKNKVKTLNTSTSGAANSGTRSIENMNNPKNDLMAQNSTSNENELLYHGKNIQIVQNTPQPNLQSILKNIRKKVQDKPMNSQVKSYVKVLKPTVSQPESQLYDVSQLQNNTSLYNIQFSLNNQAQSNADISNRNELLNITRSKSLVDPLTHSWRYTYNGDDTSNDSVLSSRLKAPKKISNPQTNSARESQLPSQYAMVRDTNVVSMKRTPPLNHKETANGVIGRQQNHRKGILEPKPNSPHSPKVLANECPIFVTPIYSTPPTHKSIILKGTPVRLPPYMHHNYGNPIPTLVNHNLYQPRPLTRPSRFISPWPPPSTNVVHNVSQVNMKTNGVPNCRMPIVSTNMPGHAMYPEFWRPKINENYRNYFMCPPPQPPPPPPPMATVPQNINTGLPIAPPSPTGTGTVIGSNAEGQLIKKITISTVPPPQPSLANDKEKMLAELNSAVEEIEAASDILEELKNNTLNDSEHVKIKSVPSAKPKFARPCPLSKKKHNLQHTDVEERAKLAVAQEPIKGYSPPILPIPSYQQAFEILAKNEQKMADILKKMESINAKKDLNFQTIKKTPGKDTKNKHIDSKTIKKKLEKHTKNKQVDCKTMKRKSPVPEKKKVEKMKKISLDEYKRKLDSNNVSISAGSKSKKPKHLKGLSVDYSQDLGYDSDATLVL